MDSLAKELTELLTSRGAALVGFADLSPLDEASRRGFPRAVSFCLALDRAVIAELANGPHEAYCREYNSTNEQLTAMANEAAAWLVARGHRSQARPATHDWDHATFRAPFQHKTAATLAGLGWVGKCALLVTPQYGPAVRWASVLTDAPLPVGTPIVESRCGDCRACVDACPGGAPSGKLWRQGMAREDFWDHQACLRGMKKIAAEHATSLGICGLCVAVCPHGRR